MQGARHDARMPHKTMVLCLGVWLAWVGWYFVASGANILWHTFHRYYPVNVLNAIKMVPEVCRIFCATANPVEVVVAETERGRGLLGVIDGLTPKGVEGEDDIAWRKNLLRQFGYKL